MPLVSTFPLTATAALTAWAARIAGVRPITSLEAVLVAAAITRLAGSAVALLVCIGPAPMHTLLVELAFARTLRPPLRAVVAAAAHEICTRVPAIIVHAAAFTSPPAFGVPAALALPVLVHVLAGRPILSCRAPAIRSIHAISRALPFILTRDTAFLILRGSFGLVCSRDRWHAKAEQQHENRGPGTNRVHCKAPSRHRCGHGISISPLPAFWKLGR
ncbi:MAG TPA: hypothetical protein VK176_13470 [Phycisphaerales bacterium]|nr:hypothetical protein [Phycisphaerales bacterium]